VKDKKNIITQYLMKLKNKGYPEPKYAKDLVGESKKSIFFLSTSKPQQGQISFSIYSILSFVYLNHHH